MLISEIMTQPAKTVRASATVAEAAEFDGAATTWGRYPPVRRTRS
jgi:hypothetical protein